MARRRSIQLDDLALDKLATALVPSHGALISDGYRLTGRRQLFACKNGSFTAQFTYRNRRARVSMVFTCRGIQL